MALPVNGSTHLIPAYYSIYRPRKDERLSWLTYSGWLRPTHISGHQSAAGRAQDRESSPARDRRSTYTVPRHQLLITNEYELLIGLENSRDQDRCLEDYKTGKLIAVSNWPHRYRNSQPIWDHTVLPATRLRSYSRPYLSRSWYSIKRPQRDAVLR